MTEIERLRARLPVLRARLARLLTSGWPWLLGHLGRHSRRFAILGKRSVTEFAEDDCPQLAAAISYHVMLSVFPLVILVVSVFNLVVNQQSVRDNVVEGVETYVPLTAHGEQSLRHLLTQLQGGSAALGLLGLLGLVISASGMMTSTRRALTRAWDAEIRRPFVRGKLFDILLVGASGIVVVTSFGLTVLVRLARSGSAGAASSLGSFGALANAAGWLVGFLVPALLAFALFTLFYRFLPAVQTRFTNVWHGALVGALLFQGLKEGFAAYLDHFAHYNEIYGALGTAAAFIFFVYLAANAFLLGAEVASEYPRLPALRKSRAKSLLG
jgi:membrane protein